MATTTIEREVQRRRVAGRGRPKRVEAWWYWFSATLFATSTVSAQSARADRYRENPVAYAHDVLGVQTWSAQDDILKAMTAHRARVAVRSGQKVGKSKVAAFLALWFYDTHEDARVVVTAPTSRQVDTIFWREIKRHVRRSAQPIDGRIGELARTGLKADDQREIVGFTATEAESVAGVSGKNLLYIVDEASGVSREIFDAIEGNRASAAAKILLISNPTRTEGTFFDAFHGKKEFYKTFTVSAEQTPNVLERREVIPGLASIDHIEEKRREWGVDSPQYKIRVLGEHSLNEDGKIISIQAIVDAEARWEASPAAGRLHIGVDPAGPGQGGDESAFAVRRGQKIKHVHAASGLTADAHIVQIVGLLGAHHEPNDLTPVVAIDSEGPIGAELFYALRAYLEQHKGAFILVRVRSSEKATRERRNYDRVRDEMFANFELWLREGGAIPTDAKLSHELHAASWYQLPGRALLKATPKSELRTILGRSPDRADACMLSVWEPSVLDEVVAEETPTKTFSAEPDYGPKPTMDPYAAMRTWGGR